MKVLLSVIMATLELYRRLLAEVVVVVEALVVVFFVLCEEVGGRIVGKPGDGVQGVFEGNCPVLHLGKHVWNGTPQSSTPSTQTV